MILVDADASLKQMKGIQMATDIKDFLLKTLKEKDENKSRSKQRQVGPSEIGGCRRKVWYRLNEQPETNFELSKLAAIMGTAIHAEIEKAIETIDPDGKKYIVESEIEYDGIKAHIDLWIPETGDVVDWKTVKKSNLSYFPSKQQRWQVQVYGYLLEKSGKGKPNFVNLVAIARDGNEEDVKVHTEAYNPALAEEALAWLNELKIKTDAPDPEKDANFCKSYCQYYDASGQMGCVGLKKEIGTSTEVIIDDAEVDKHALHYLQLDAKIKDLEKERDSYKESLVGLKGVTNSGVSINWSTVAGRKVVDVDELIKAGIEIPYKVGNESTRLSIKLTGGN